MSLACPISVDVFIHAKRSREPLSELRLKSFFPPKSSWAAFPPWKFELNLSYVFHLTSFPIPQQAQIEKNGKKNFEGKIHMDRGWERVARGESGAKASPLAVRPNLIMSQTWSQFLVGYYRVIPGHINNRNDPASVFAPSLPALFRARGKQRGFSPGAAACHRSRTRGPQILCFLCVYFWVKCFPP